MGLGSEGAGMDKHLWQKAASFAAQKHAGQLRNDDKTPYVAHPFRVAMTIRDVFKVEDPAALGAWYRQWLDLPIQVPYGASFLPAGLPTAGRR